MPRTTRLGTVREIPRKGSGNWAAYLPLRLSPGQKVKARVQGRFSSKTEASAALRKAVALIESGKSTATSLRKPKRRLEQAVDEYISARKSIKGNYISTKTIRGYQSVKDALFSLKIGENEYRTLDVEVEKINRPFIHRWFEDLRNAELTQSQIDHMAAFLSSVLSKEVQLGNLDSNPLLGHREPRSKQGTSLKHSKDSVVIPTLQELAHIVNNTSRYEDALFIATIAWGGLRFSEATALTSDSVNAKEPKLKISRVLARVKGNEWKEEVPKNGRIEDVRIPTQLWKELIRLKELRVNQPPMPEPAGRLLYRSKRQYLKQDRLQIIDNSNFRRDVWNQAMIASGFTAKKSSKKKKGAASLRAVNSELTPIAGLKIKDLRAFFASMLCDVSATPNEVKNMMRHQSIATTDRHYIRNPREPEQDLAITRIRNNRDLNGGQRLDALFDLWIKRYPEVLVAIRPRAEVASKSSVKAAHKRKSA